MRVVDDGFGRIGHTIAPPEPTIAQIAVLCGRKPRVEAAYTMKTRDGNSQIVRRKETRAVLVVVIVHDIHDQLAHLGKRIILKQIKRAATDNVIRRFKATNFELSQPVGS